MTDKDTQRKRAVKLTLPVFCGYIFLGIAFGATLAQAGFGVAWALAISTFVYAGSLQFVMIPFGGRNVACCRRVDGTDGQRTSSVLRNFLHQVFWKDG